MNLLAWFVSLFSWRWLSLVSAFLAGLLLGGAFIHGWQRNEIADLKAAQATAQTLAEHAALARWQAATLRADAAESRLIQSSLAQQQSLQEKHHGLSVVATGRPCLSGAAVGLLNGTGLRLSAMPAPAGQPDPVAAPFASDTDVGDWIAVAQSQYEQCRNTRQALIEWWHD